MYSLLMAIFFMLGRKYLRDSERFSIELPIQVEGIQNQRITKDLSDMGLSFICDYPHYLSPDQIIQFQINNIIFKGQIKHVSCCHSQWKYGVEITSFLPGMKPVSYTHLTNERLDRIVRFHLGPIKLHSTVMSSCEIAAHAFAKELLHLNDLPNVYDYILLIHQKEMTIDGFQTLQEQWRREIGE